MSLYSIDYGLPCQFIVYNEYCLNVTIMFLLDVHVQLNYKDIFRVNNVSMQTINIHANRTNEAIIVQC